MIKKEIKKNSTSLVTKKIIPKINQTEKILMENSVALQKVMVDLAEKFTNLSGQMSKLLGIFETSAKTLAEKDLEDNQEVVQKLNALLDQNKILAKGITLLHETEEEIKEDISKTPRVQPQQIPSPMPPQTPKSNLSQLPQNQMPMPQTNIQMPTPQTMPSQKQAPINIQEYQKSISAN